MSPGLPDARSERADDLVGRRSLDAIDVGPGSRASTTAVIVTADHGGMGADHADATRARQLPGPVHGAAGPGVAPGADLYDLNPDYADPGDRRTSYADPRQPVRNGDVANLAIDLLGLPPCPGSEHNAAQDLDVAARHRRPSRGLGRAESATRLAQDSPTALAILLTTAASRPAPAAARRRPFPSSVSTQPPVVEGTARQGQALQAFPGRWTPERRGDRATGG